MTSSDHRDPAGVLMAALVAVLLGGAVAAQIARDRIDPGPAAAASILYVPSGPVLQRLALSYDALLADVYWIRAIQHYGRTKLTHDPAKSYALLHPLLDITTTLDPRFNIAYRFGAIFLAERFPSGPGRPDLSIALLRKGLAANPARWEYLQDIGFIHYWWRHDYVAAAEAFQQAARLPGAPNWLVPLAAVTLTQGGDRRASRFIWEQIQRGASDDYLRREAGRRLRQLEALDQIDRLRQIVRAFHQRTGRWPNGWGALVAAGLLRAAPVDATGTPFVLLAESDVVDLASTSPLYPLPAEPPAAMRPAS